MPGADIFQANFHARPPVAMGLLVLAVELREALCHSCQFVGAGVLHIANNYYPVPHLVRSCRAITYSVRRDFTERTLPHLV